MNLVKKIEYELSDKFSPVKLLMNHLHFFE